MNQTYMTIAGISFLAGLATGIWPRACLDKARTLLQESGKGQVEHPTFAQIREVDAKLFKTYVVGMVISVTCSVVFLVFALLACFT